VKVATATQHAELMQVLDDRLVATADVPGRGQTANGKRMQMIGICWNQWKLFWHVLT